MEINYVCSFGTLCHSLQILKRNNLKLCSYPFDWIFSNCNNIIHSIEDDFNIFLDKSYYINISEKKCGHSYYCSHMWWHHDPLNNEDDYNYYIRCINRFRNLIKLKENKLFTMIYLDTEFNENFKNNIIIFNNKLSKYINNYILLVILNLDNKENNYHSFIYHDNIHFLELHTLSSSNGLYFINDNDNIYLDNIIKTYNFNIKNI
jgi:hypothetical protein